MTNMYSFLVVYIGALHNISVSTDIVIVRVSIFNASYLFFQRIYNVYILLLHLHAQCVNQRRCDLLNHKAYTFELLQLV